MSSNIRVNQQEIADKLDIARSTVTKVLNHDPVYSVAPETRSLILKTAREIGYRPRRRRTNNIALIICGPASSAEMALHFSICEEASNLQYRVFLVNKQAMPSYREISMAVNPLSADGAIILGTFSPKVAQQLADVMPVVLFDPTLEVSGVDFVHTDDRDLGRRLTELQIEAGHTNIAVIVHSRHDSMWSQPLQGYEDALKNAGIPFDSSMVYEKYRRLYPELLAEILERKPKPTALLVWTIADHAIILSTLLAMGYVVPKDLSYVGWAASPDQSNLLPFPVIACLADVHESMAQNAVRELLDRVEDKYKPSKQVCVPVNIRRGGTCSDLNGADF